MSIDLSKHTFETLYFEPTKIEKFYYDILKDAKIYKRVTAYFSANIFKYLKNGLPEFISNDGYMQLVLSIDALKSDKRTIDAINKGYKSKELNKGLKITNSEIINHIKNVSSDEFDIFSFLIAVGKLDVKIAYKSVGILHDKFGYVSDGVHQLVYVGSANFTENGVRNNDETIQTTIDWENPSKRELNTIRQIDELFDSIWQNSKNGVVTIDLPDPVIDSLISNIDYKKVEKVIKQTNFIRFDINDSREVILTSNIDISEILGYNNIYDYFYFIKKREKDYILKDIALISEIYDFKTKLEQVCANYKTSLFLTKRAKDFFDLNYKNYDKEALAGTVIKADSFFNTKKFLLYRDSINALVKRPLKDKQIQAAAHFIELERDLNFSVPGSGKTATVLGAYVYLSNLERTDKRRIERILVIGPINCSKSWIDEYKTVVQKKDYVTPLCLINNKDSKNDKNDVLIHDFYMSKLIILNYDIVDKLKETLCKLIDDKTLVVFDEIHRIKKVDSVKYRALKQIADKTRYRIALTGTPLPNGYIDLYNMMRLLHDDFTMSYFDMVEHGLKKYDSRYRRTGLQNSELNEKLRPFFIRVSKEDLNVPLAEPDNLITINTNKYEIGLYNEIINSKFSSFEEVVKLVEIGCVPFKCREDVASHEASTVKKISSDIDKYLTSKICKFLQILKKNNNKCVVWCNFVDTIRLVTHILKVKGYRAKSIYGETIASEREKIIDEFNYGNLQILVTNPATLAESVSLHKACHEAHYLELNYNLYQYLQSRDRIHRLGLKSTDKTNYYIYINLYNDEKHSIDLKIYEALKKKEYMMQKTIKNGNFVFGDDQKTEYK